MMAEQTMTPDLIRARAARCFADAKMVTDEAQAAALRKIGFAFLNLATQLERVRDTESWPPHLQ